MCGNTKGEWLPVADRGLSSGINCQGAIDLSFFVFVLLGEIGDRLLESHGPKAIPN